MEEIVLYEIQNHILEFAGNLPLVLPLPFPQPSYFRGSRIITFILEKNLWKNPQQILQ